MTQLRIKPVVRRRECLCRSKVMGWIHSRGNDEARHCRFDAPSETEPSTEKHEWVTLGQKRIFQRDLAEIEI